MSHQQFVVSTVNPNDAIGGGGCVCDERKQVDCKGPFVVCYGNSMLDERSPHVVVCATCVAAMAAKLEAEPVVAGEQGRPGPESEIEKRPLHRDSEDPATAPPVTDNPDPDADFVI